MFDCAYCERPLLCGDCGVPFVPATPEEYEALFRRDVPVACRGCRKVLVCRWCRTPYDGREGDSDDPDDDSDPPEAGD
ncbi:hypothetical protein [Aquisphaera insulae]|uniref:hypothetical protein n=1 Tax=Aquisphaera insulae TaxID=2712864 RepID=UPI0013EB6B93|nr:hypothetical protein [Aquisphaera insulae]